MFKFEGQADFLFTREEMEAVVGGENSLIGKELKVSGLVRDWWLNDTSSGYQSAIVFSKTIRIRYLEGSVVTFKPDLPFKVHVSAEQLDPFCVSVNSLLLGKTESLAKLLYHRKSLSG